MLPLYLQAGLGGSLSLTHAQHTAPIGGKASAILPLYLQAGPGGSLSLAHAQHTAPLGGEGPCLAPPLPPGRPRGLALTHTCPAHCTDQGGGPCLAPPSTSRQDQGARCHSHTPSTLHRSGGKDPASLPLYLQAGLGGSLSLTHPQNTAPLGGRLLPTAHLPGPATPAEPGDPLLSHPPRTTHLIRAGKTSVPLVVQKRLCASGSPAKPPCLW